MLSDEASKMNKRWFPPMMRLLHLFKALYFSNAFTCSNPHSNQKKVRNWISYCAVIYENE